MKKILYSFLLFAVALVSTTALVSCGGDDDENDAPQPSQTASLDFKLWLSEDLQKIADIKATGISTPLSCTNKCTLEVKSPIDGSTLSYEGLASQNIHLEGAEAKNAKIQVTFELKPNWKELIANQEKVKCRCSWIYAYVNGGTTHTNYNQAPEISDWDVEKILNDKEAENMFVQRITSRMNISFSTANW